MEGGSCPNRGSLLNLQLESAQADDPLDELQGQVAPPIQATPSLKLMHCRWQSLSTQQQGPDTGTAPHTHTLARAALQTAG